jgi:hypothetical protein
MPIRRIAGCAARSGRFAQSLPGRDVDFVLAAPSALRNQLLLLVLVIAYFVVLGRTGGTVFQRLFGMKRAK